jgi:hypothetical protein
LEGTPKIKTGTTARTEIATTNAVRFAAGEAAMDHVFASWL